ncbi:FMRFamide receptor-like [Mya arenaria]|uniref:FMRFamide receptor-like n=1 Tax=Mya arenaria TaxID=6604 RepID=UPI0022E2927E|nr:FMRFamide receptor-like [Mya arenaria]XP_052768155.1 FMRFamide receptor-like [Mya arenaria]XP_052768163.1 FMRFamide receptor-like [Mya arenaria]XP_052768167.1 FMRFamide receptor-like [Mya arenaria]XP_052768173.1 FMRFamide receptor-like [Mya arenaria]XP_052768179.1 FMRFamide receptor-like [Mya arenaria]XP_052768185.1 FMRFamide receptor-like [Mya arenaria]XP_052768191.1 FMRFamide receptor-like [Mya arenaria]XP_052768198.1 FMRFamide receptor-like [Mya arenaria]XP_052768204.1 FMRFamide rece
MPASEINLKVNMSYGDEYIQDDDAKTARLMFIFWGVIVPIIGVIGFIGNILTIVVLFRREMKSTTVYFLRTLVVTDTGIIVGCILGLSIISITQLNPDMWRFTDVVYPHIYTPINYIVMTLQFINVWVTVAVSVERYIAICHPFRAVKFCNKKNAFLVIGIISCVAIFYNIPRCFATMVTPCDAWHQCFSIITTTFGKSEFYEKYYTVYFYLMLIYIVPLVLLGILNTLLILELMRMRKRRTVGNIQENSETNMSIVLILIVVVFILCQTPGLVAQFWFLGESVLLQWLCVSNTLFAFNSSVNFLIYTAVGRKFRKVLLKTFQILIKRPVNEFKLSYSQNGGTELTKLAPKPAAYDSEEVSEETCSLKCNR